MLNFKEILSVTLTNFSGRVTQDGILAGELSVHQGGVWHEIVKDDRLDGECGQSYCQDHGRQGLYISGVQEGERYFPCN